MENVEIKAEAVKSILRTEWKTVALFVVFVLLSVMFSIIFPAITLFSGWIWPVAAGAIGMGVCCLSFPFIVQHVLSVIIKMLENLLKDEKRLTSELKEGIVSVWHAINSVSRMLQATWPYLVMGGILAVSGILLAVFPAFWALVTIGLATALAIPLGVGVGYFAFKAYKSTLSSENLAKEENLVKLTEAVLERAGKPKSAARDFLKGIVKPFEDPETKPGADDPAPQANAKTEPTLEEFSALFKDLRKRLNDQKAKTRSDNQDPQAEAEPKPRLEDQALLLPPLPTGRLSSVQASSEDNKRTNPEDLLNAPDDRQSRLRSSVAP